MEIKRKRELKARVGRTVRGKVRSGTGGGVAWREGWRASGQGKERSLKEEIWLDRLEHKGGR